MERDSNVTPEDISASRVLRSLEAEPGVAFRCPACNDTHYVITAGPGPYHHVDGTPDHPTFWPGITVTRATMFGEERCHSFITIGQISYQADCTHHLAGRRVTIQPWPDQS